MIFTELRFVGFFLLAFAVYWTLQRNRSRKIWLLACSYVFYGAWDWRFLSLIVVSTLIDFWVGVRLDGTDDPRRRKRFVTLSVCMNLGLLGFFKYFNWFLGSGVTLAQWLGIPVDEVTLSIVLPVGISFYTFQTMSYSIDVYRGKLKATHELLDLALFVGFFPQLMAGPIVRAITFMPQLPERRRFGWIMVRSCLTLFLLGFIKKAVVSDSIAEIIDKFYLNPSEFSTFSTLLTGALFSVQLDCDFSGYSDMAIGCAGLLGYNLCDNFDYPLFAPNITEFWRRWHISLSSWLRDYLYIPLGGSRGGTLFVWRNLMITMTLCGLWHGATWGMFLFGALHGVGLVVNRTWLRFRDARLPASVGTWLRYPGIVITFAFFSWSLFLFRSPDIEGAWTGMRTFALLGDGGTRLIGDRLIWVLLGLAVVHALSYKRVLAAWWQRLPAPVFAGAYGMLVAATLSMMHTHAEPFVYFQF